MKHERTIRLGGKLSDLDLPEGSEVRDDLESGIGPIGGLCFVLFSVLFPGLLCLVIWAAITVLKGHPFRIALAAYVVILVSLLSISRWVIRDIWGHR